MNETPFVPKRLEEERSKDKFEIISIKLNKQDRLLLDDLKLFLQQEKDSTAIKQGLSILSKVILDDKTKAVLDVVLNNYRKNKRLNIVSFD